MRISIITATYNSTPTIAGCLASVYQQTYKNIEHIIIDGASTDNTLEIIKNTPSRITKIISEPDLGIYDAMNKGIKLATGDIIGILNSDDFLASDDILELIAQTFEKEKCDAIFGNLDFVASNDPIKVIRRWKSSPFEQGSFAKGWHSPHPTFYVKREVYEKFGNFDITLDVSADFEIMLRFIERYKIETHYLDRVIVKMRYGGESTGSIRKIIRGNRNIIKAFKKNGIKVSPFYPFIRIVPKLKQFISK